MNRTTVLFASAMFALSSACFAQVIAFENVNVVPMDRDRTIEKQTVVIRDGRIAQIGPAGKVKVPDGATRVDATGKFLIPGLAEMHGHLPPPDAPPELVEHILHLYIANGVTTVRGMQGNPAALQHRDAVAGGRMLGPRLYVAGPVFSGNSAKTVEDAQKMVRDQKAAGYDLLKITEGLSPAVYDAIARTAREVKIDFAGHVPNDVGVRKAIEAKQRSIDHLDNYIEALAPDSSSSADGKTRAHELPFKVDEGKMNELARLTRQAGVWNVPTMALWEVFHNNETGEHLRERMPEIRYMPRSQVEKWVAQKNSLLQPGSDIFMGFGVGSKTGARVIELRRLMLKNLRAAGAKVALGTDSPQVFSVPGFSILREMQVMVECGYTPFEVLQTGTRNVAEYFGTLNETGTVSEGKRADLVLLEGNPLNAVANISRKAGVVVNGRWIPESEIKAKLEQQATWASTH